MQRKGKYEPFGEFLKLQNAKGIFDFYITADEFERIIGDSLPSSHYNHTENFWANDKVGHTHSRIWLENGYKVIDAKEIRQTGKIHFVLNNTL